MTFGWFRLKDYIHSGNQPKTKITIIIPARNEEKNIKECLNDLINQDYPNGLYEIIIIDDDSDDNTYGIIKSYIDDKIKESPLLILLKNSNNDQRIAGKKQAIRSGIERASGELIITTDADCRFNSKWINLIADYFNKNDIKLLSGPVVFSKSNNLFISSQSLEFMSLIASTAGFISIGVPILGNAANLSFEKDVFPEVERTRTDYDHASGDDIFLIRQVRKYYGSSAIGFIKNKDAIVFTEAKPGVKEFFSQRMRWVSKSRRYNDYVITTVSWFTFLVNFSLLAGFVTGALYPKYISYALILLIIKLIIEFPLMLGIASFADRKRLLWLYIPVEIVNIFYIVVIAIAGVFFKTKWKGREIY